MRNQRKFKTNERLTTFTQRKIEVWNNKHELFLKTSEKNVWKQWKIPEIEEKSLIHRWNYEFDEEFSKNNEL